MKYQLAMPCTVVQSIATANEDSLMCPDVLVGQATS